MHRGGLSGVTMRQKFAIKVEGLAKSYGNLLAVDHISFHVEDHEIFGFLGPNGAGKTTTLRMLTGVLKPDEGKAEIMGHDISRESFYAKMAMGIVPEVANAYIDLSAWNNLMLIGELYGVPKQRRRGKASELLRMFELYERKDEKVKGFSKGMKQRLVLCMALINDPQILFLDEPTAGLDVQSARLIRNLIGELNEGGVAVFLTTHNIEEANQMCHRVAIINYGRIVVIDSPENLRQTFRSVQSVEVAFTRPLGIETLRKIPGVDMVRKVGDKFRLYTDNQAKVIDNLVDYARAKNLQIITLSTLGPSLEDVFVKLTEDHEKL